MVGNSFNPHWEKAAQYQQRQKQLQPSQRPRGGPHAKDDFGDEWRDRNVEMECVKGQAVEVIRGRVVDVSKY